jgi:hypothetical protein
MAELLELVQKIRVAMETEAVKRSYIGFNDFPDGACMDASILLGVILHRHGLGAFQLVSAWNEIGRRFSHAWLENEELLIDITGDQFESWPAQPLVLDISKLPIHYQSLEIQFKAPVLQYNNVPDLGFYSAMKIVENIILT